MSALDLKYWLIKARDLLSTIAPVTPIKSDDALVVVINAILADAELFGYFETQVSNDANGVLQLTTDPPVALQASLQAAKIDWATVLSMLPTIIQLIKTLRS